MMKTKAIMLTALAAAALMAQSAIAGTVAYSTVTLKAKSDTRIAAPQIRQCIGKFDITSVANAASSEITLDSDPGVASDGTYYVRVVGGAFDGRWFTIRTNASGVLTLDEGANNTSANPIDLTGITTSDCVYVLAHWTVGTIFPANLNKLSFGVSDVFGGDFPITLILPNNAVGGTNKPVDSTFSAVFVDSSAGLGQEGWFNTSAFAFVDDYVIAPSATVIVRNENDPNTGVTDDPQTLVDESNGDYTLVTLGDCKDLKLTEVIPTYAGDNDHIMHLDNASPITLGESGLATSGVIREVPASFTITDTVFTFDPAAAGQNKPVSATVSWVYLGTDAALGLTGDPTPTWFNTSSFATANDAEIDCGQVLLIQRLSDSAGSVTHMRDPLSPTP